MPIPTTLTCTPEALLPEVSCLVCAGSRQQLLAGFDAFLCETLNREGCSPATVLELAKPLLALSDRELIASATYLWLLFLAEEDPDVDTSFQAMGIVVSPFAQRSNIELLAMQYWLLCQMVETECDPADLLNAGRCFCLSFKELLAIRLYLLGQFIGNFVEVDLDPDTLRELIEENIGFVSTSSLEATTVWLMCQLYDFAVENQEPT